MELIIHTMGLNHITSREITTQGVNDALNYVKPVGINTTELILLDSLLKEM